MSNPLVLIETSMGEILIELFAEQAPETVKNFLQYVDDKFYDGVIFHRVIKNFMIQGGGLAFDMKEKPTRAPIKNEASPALPNLAGTIAMARTPDPHSASAQFFINLKDNAFLNHTAPTMDGFGYCVFGKVAEGFENVEKIGKVKTRSYLGHDDVPAEPVSIISAVRFEA
ncbi:MAG: peptidylprolyl isomerase [Thermodesulfobacteriota bacterium]